MDTASLLAGALTVQSHDCRIVAKVNADPWTLTREKLLADIGGRKQSLTAAVKRLLDKGELSERNPAKGSKSKATVLGPGKVVAAQWPTTSGTTS